MEDKLRYQDLLLCGSEAFSSLRHGLCSDHLWNNKCSRSKSSCSRSTDLLILVLLDSQILKKLQRHPDGLTGTRVGQRWTSRFFGIRLALPTFLENLFQDFKKINQLLKLHLPNLLPLMECILRLSQAGLRAESSTSKSSTPQSLSSTSDVEVVATPEMGLRPKSAPTLRHGAGGHGDRDRDDPWRAGGYDYGGGEDEREDEDENENERKGKGKGKTSTTVSIPSGLKRRSKPG